MFRLFRPIAPAPQILLLVSLAVLIFSVRANVLAEDLPMYGKVPEFNLKDQNGDPFGTKDLANKIWVADFFYSNCHSTCPIQSSYLSVLQQKWKNRKDFKIVSFTVDPKNDTVDQLAQYAKDYEANNERWFFLTGDKTTIYKLIRYGFKVTAYADNSTSIPDFIHTTRMVLVDGNDNIRGYYDSLSIDDQNKLESDLKQLLRSNHHQP